MKTRHTFHLLEFFFVFTSLPSLALAGHFDKCWSGGAYNSTAVYVVQARINGIDLAPEDEIGVFDQEICVGDKIVNGAVASFQAPLLIETSQDDGDGCGFQDGHAITIKVWDDSEALELTAALQFYDLGTGAPIAPASFQGNSSVAIGFDIPYPSGEPEIHLSPAAYDFGNLVVGQGLSHTFIISNIGDAPLTIQSFAITGADAGQFMLYSDPAPLTLQAGESHTTIIAFLPTSRGVKSGCFDVWSDDQEHLHVTVPLSGRGVEQDIDVMPIALDFGDVTLGTSASRSVEIHNVGDAPLTIKSLAVTGESANQFSTSGAPGVIGAGGRMTVDISFQPQMMGVLTASFNIESDDPDEPFRYISLSGRGTLDQFSLTINVAPPTGGTTFPAAGTYLRMAGELVAIAAVPSPGYRFAGWSGDAPVTESPAITLLMDDHKSVTAHFISDAADAFLLTLIVNPKSSGSTIPAAGMHQMAKNSSVQLMAIAAQNYRFKNWLGDVDDPTNSSTTIQMNDDKIVIANFESDAHESYNLILSVYPENSGVLVPSAGVHLFSADTVVNLYAIPMSGYEFAGWSGDVTGMSSSLSVRIERDMQIAANFSPTAEIVTRPALSAVANAFMRQEIDFFVHGSSSNLSHAVEYQVDWGDGILSDWMDLSEQINWHITTMTTAYGESQLPSSGHLINYSDGRQLDIQLTVTGGSYRAAIDAGRWGATPLTRTDAYAVFGDIVDCRGAIAYVNAPNDSLRLAFSGLDPDKRYLIAFYSNADDFGWDYASQVTLTGATQFVNTSSSGQDRYGRPLCAGAGSPSVRLPADNTQTGYIARFAEIEAGEDGVVTLVISFDGNPGHEFKGKFGNAVMLGEFVAGFSAPVCTAYNDLAWGGHFLRHAFDSYGVKLVRVRARAKENPAALSDWSEPQAVSISGCLLSTTLTPGADAWISPQKELYAYGEYVTLVAQANPGWRFSHWNDNPADSSHSHAVYMNHHHTVMAHFVRESDVIESNAAPISFCLEQNFPNPFNPSTEIDYQLACDGFVSLQIYDVRGALVKQLVAAPQRAGRHRVTWKATNEAGGRVASGIYFYRMDTGPFSQTRRMLLLQ